jgi:hypothetical protein
MPAIDPGKLEFLVNSPWAIEKINLYLELREEIKDEFNQDLFYNSFDKEYGTTSLLRRTGYEPTFATTTGMHGEDAEAPGRNLFAIEIKSQSYSVKGWKLPDITSPSFSFSFDKVRQSGIREKIQKYDGYALGIFDTNYKSRPHWVRVHNFEPIVLMYITGSGAIKVTNWLLNMIDEKNEQLERDDVEFDNSHRNNRIQPKYSDVFNMLNNNDMKLIINGQQMSKSHYLIALEKGDIYWEQDMWKKSLAELRSA